ncbi:MAG: hypothetical protein LBF16_14055 [Pseudomonadales bacterium]|jgi:hypothetical protein|nr:hypothetical protein [Pseudomonadales bacterium]
MSAQQLKVLQRIKQPLTLQLQTSAPPRNHVVQALSARASGAGKHVRSQGAQRRADRMALRRLVF